MSTLTLERRYCRRAYTIRCVAVEELRAIFRHRSIDVPGLVLIVGFFSSNVCILIPCSASQTLMGCAFSVCFR